MKLTIVTGYGPDMEEVAAITVPRMKVLADRLGATMVVSSKTPADCPDRPVPWLKIKDLAEAARVLTRVRCGSMRILFSAGTSLPRTWSGGFSLVAQTW